MSNWPSNFHNQKTFSPLEVYTAHTFGVADTIGTLEVWKDATLIVTTDDPLEIICNIEMEFIQGRKIDLRSKHTMLYEKYTEKYRWINAGKGRFHKE